VSRSEVFNRPFTVEPVSAAQRGGIFYKHTFVSEGDVLELRLEIVSPELALNSAMSYTLRNSAIRRLAIQYQRVME
jgi:hypothetical protein